MTDDEYRKEINEIRKDAIKKEKWVAIRYATLKNSLTIGDVATDHIGSIRIQDIKVTVLHNHDMPSCVYFGTELKKDGKPKKNKNTRAVYQTNLIEEEGC